MNTSRATKDPLLCQISVSQTGGARLTARRAGVLFDIEIGPKYFARIAKKDARTLREITVCSASNAAAHIVTRVAVEGANIEKRTRTEYVNRTIREDIVSYESQALIRSARWVARNGTQILANYTVGERILQVTRPDGSKAAVFQTTAKTRGGGSIQATTRRLDGANTEETGPIVIGSKVIEPGKSSTIIGVVAPGSALQYSTVSMATDRRLVVTSVVPGEGSIAAASVIYDPGGNIAASVQVITSNSDGTTTVVVYQHDVSLGASDVTSFSSSSTTADGGFQSYSQVNSDGSVSQRSSYVNDGQGNESETTITYDKDGSFTIDTVNKGQDGTETTTSEAYNSDGSPKESSGGGDPGSAGGGDAGGGGGDDGGGGGNPDGGGGDPGSGGGDTGGGEMPSDDGTDERPTPLRRGPADHAFESWLSNADAYLGGRGIRPPVGGPPNPGDPAQQILSSLDQDGSSRGVPLSGGEHLGDGTFDLTPILRAMRLSDPENNPRALVEVLSKLTGVRTAGSERAAAKAVKSLSSWDI